MLLEHGGNRLQRLGVVAAGLNLKAEGSRERMIRARAARLRIVGVRLIEDRGLKRLLHSAVGGEEGNLLALELLQLERHVFKDELLRARNAGVAGRVRRGRLDVLDAQRRGVLLQQRLTSGDGLHREVAREGVMHEHINAPLGAGLHDGVALLRFVGVEHEVGSRGDDGRVFLRHARDQQHVVAAHGADLVKRGLRARNSLTHHDGLDVRIGRKRDELGDGRFGFSHEVIRVGIGDDVLRVGLLGALGGAEFFLALRGRAGQDRDLPISLGHRAGSQRQTQHRGQRQTKQFLHSVCPPSIFSIPGALSMQSVKQRNGSAFSKTIVFVKLSSL